MKIIPTFCFSLYLSFALSLHAAEPSPDFSAYEKKTPWVSEPDVIATYAKRQPKSNFAEAMVPPYTLPEMLKLESGETVATPEDWKRRRAELLKLFRSEMFGVSPPRPEDLTFRVLETDPKAMDGAATLKRIAASFTLAGETFTIPITLFVPNERSGPAPVFLLLNHRGVENTDPTRKTKMEFWPAEYAIARGYAMAAINVAADIDPDHRDATTGVREFYRKHHPQAADFTWATLAAWAWSGSRAVDYFATDDDIDSKRIAVIGHSRTGKTALWGCRAGRAFRARVRKWRRGKADPRSPAATSAKRSDRSRVAFPIGLLLVMPPMPSASTTCQSTRTS